jgi:hypothetical protein
VTPDEHEIEQAIHARFTALAEVPANDSVTLDGQASIIAAG